VTAVEWSPRGATFVLGGVALEATAVPVGPEVLATWEDRFDGDPDVRTLMARVDWVIAALLAPPSARAYQRTVRRRRGDPVGIFTLDAVGQWLFEQHLMRPFRASRRLFKWARMNWNQLDGYALAHGTMVDRLSLRQLLNVTYWALVDGADEKERARLDRRLEADETPDRGGPMIDPGALQLLQLMRGG